MDEIALVRSFAPVVTPSSPEAITVARRRLLDHIAAPAARRRWAGLRLPAIRRPIALALVGLVVVGGLSAVAAGVYFGEWGPVDHPATAAEIDAEISATIATTPLPAGMTYPIAQLRGRAEPAGNLTRFAGVQQVQFFAMCAWSGAWLDADRVGDRAARDAATAVIGRFPTWQAVADPRLADGSIRTQVDGVVDGVVAGDPRPLAELFDGMACSSILGQ